MGFSQWLMPIQQIALPTLSSLRPAGSIRWLNPPVPFAATFGGLNLSMPSPCFGQT
jgi:hypothetical protein